MIEFRKIDKYIILVYSPHNDVKWLFDLLEEKNSYNIKNTFNVTKDLYSKAKKIIEDFGDDVDIEYHSDADSICFVFAELVSDYYIIDSEILGINFQLSFHKDIKLKKEYFVQYNNISVFKNIEAVFNSKKLCNLCIGGENETLSLESFKNIIKKFPNSYEVNRYCRARVSSFLRNEFDDIEDYEKKYEKYLNKKLSKKFTKKEFELTIEKNEYWKFKYYVDKLEHMYNKYEAYSEDDWQTQIIEIFKIIYPKYIKVLPKVVIKDYFSNSKREIDMMLIDASGYVDIVEIKKPKPCGVLYKSKYRNNYVPVRELQGSVLQIENYLLSLTKNSDQCEKKIMKKIMENHSTSLPNDLKVKIINPIGFIIYGLEKDMDEKQMNDFEIVKRMYSKVVDIITYDELLRRLKNIRDSFNDQYSSKILENNMTLSN